MTTTNTITSFSDAGMMATYAIVSDEVLGDQTYFAFGAANADGFDHFKTLGENSIGLEDWYGGGTKDHDDLILGFDFQLAA